MIGSTLLSLLIMLVSFIVAIGILVSVHEYGHFWVARKLGIRVLKFSIGFGKPLWKRTSKKDGVEYVIASIPLGGYVKMLDEREGNVTPEDAPFSYNRAPIWKRILTLLAGPFANLIFAVLVYWVLLMVGIPGLKPVVGEITADSFAAQAGLRSNDLITAVQGEAVTTREGVLIGMIDNIADGAVQFTVRSDMGKDTPHEVVLQPGKNRRDLTEPETMLSGLGFDFWMPHLPAVIETVAPDGVAAKAGIQAGDEILSVNNQLVVDLTDVSKLINPLMNHQATLVIKRADRELNIPVMVAEQTTDGRSVGRIGIQLRANYIVPNEMRALQKFGPIAAFTSGVQQTWQTSATTVKLLWRMIAGQVSTKNLMGAVSMVEFSGAAARQGPVSFLNFLALISISIGIFNLLPIPMLDGGQIVYQLVELLKGSPVSERMQLISQQVGVAMLLMLLSLTLYNDIARHLG